MVAKINPRQVDPNPFNRSSPDTPAIMVRENTISVKNSGGPKRNAKLARIPAKKISDRFEMKSAVQEEYSAISSARRASPFWASG